MLRLILWIFILFLIYRILASIILPWAVRTYVARAKRSYQNRQEAGRRIRVEDGEGEIIMPKPGHPKKTHGPANSGIEDVPYEEL